MPNAVPRRPSFPVQRFFRTLAVALSVAGYCLLAPVGYLTFAFLCWFGRKQPLVGACLGGACTIVKSTVG